MMSIVQVAKIANVSKSTVSRVLSGSLNVSPAAVTAVKTAMLQLDYQEPARKRGPKVEKRKRTRRNSKPKNVLFLIGDRSKQEFRELSHLSTTPRILYGVERIIYRHGMNLIMVGKSQMKRFPALIKQTRPVGALWLSDGSQYPQQVLAWMLENPTVQLLHNNPRNSWSDMIEYSNSRVGELAADYFLARGHKHVAFFNLSFNHPPAAERKQAFIEKFEAAGGQVIDLSPTAPLESDMACLREAERLISKMLECDSLPTGIFGAADAMTCIAHHVLREHGVEPMKDIDILSCDNTKYYMEQMTPRPATIDIGFELIGERALEMLCWRVNNPGRRQNITQVIEPIIIEPLIEK
jgi:LacI family transcriptional regulator, galactose operon repressor